MAKRLMEGHYDEEDRSNNQRREARSKYEKPLKKDSYFGITVSEVSGHGRQGGLTLQWRVGEYHVDLLPKVKLEGCDIGPRTFQE